MPLLNLDSQITTAGISMNCSSHVPHLKLLSTTTPFFQEPLTAGTHYQVTTFHLIAYNTLSIVCHLLTSNFVIPFSFLVTCLKLASSASHVTPAFIHPCMHANAEIIIDKKK